MPNSAEIASNIVANLALTEPTLDTSVGSVIRKVIDAVAGAVAEQSADNHLINYTYDIDSKSGADLTDFVALFGFKRLAAGRATGVVTFKRSSALAANSLTKVPMGTQVNTWTDPPQSYQTIMNATLARGQLSVDIPVQAFTPGPSANVSAASLTVLAATVEGVETVTNPQPCTGGTSEETDEHLRARFKTTVFRNYAGTADMYRAMALQVPADADPTQVSASGATVVSRAVTAANVLGPRATYREQVMIGPDGTAQSSIPDAAYIYLGHVYLGRNIAAGDIEPQGADQSYTVTIDNSISYPDHPHATLTVTSVGDALSQTTPYDLQLDYVSSFSRNDPFGNRWEGGAHISTRVDLWINGLQPRGFTQACAYSTNASLTFLTDALHQGVMDPTRFKMNYPNPTYANKIAPVDGDRLTPLLRGPVIAVPNTLTDPRTHATFTEGIHYDIVHQADAFGFGPTSRCGLLWHAAAAGLPTPGAKFSIGYTYDAAPGAVQANIESQWRLLGTDCQVHGGRVGHYRFHLAVVYLPGYSQNSVNLGINSALDALVNSLGFRSALQVSDVLQAVHNVSGVDNVRFLTVLDDSVNYAIQRMYRDPLYDANLMAPGHTTPAIPGPVIATSSGRAKDVYFDDASYPLFDPTMSPVRILTKARNTFGAG